MVDRWVESRPGTFLARVRRVWPLWPRESRESGAWGDGAVWQGFEAPRGRELPPTLTGGRAGGAPMFVSSRGPRVGGQGGQARLRGLLGVRNPKEVSPNPGEDAALTPVPGHSLRGRLLKPPSLIFLPVSFFTACAL